MARHSDKIVTQKAVTEVIIHDLYVWEMLNAHREALESTFGAHLSALRAKFPAYGAGFHAGRQD